MFLDMLDFQGTVFLFHPQKPRHGELNEHSITAWMKKLKASSLLCAMIGVAPSDVPDVVNHPEVAQDRQDSLHPFRRKPRKKLGKNQKQPPHHPGVIQKFVDLALRGKSFESRPERLLGTNFCQSCCNTLC